MKHFINRYGLSVLFCLCGLCSYALAPTSPKETSKKTVSIKRAKTDKKLEAAMDKYLKAAADEKLNIQSVMVLQHGKVKYEKWWNGGEAQTPHILNSVSKTFTSAAVDRKSVV